MQASKLLIPTLKETPADAEIISHQLLLRAGMIKKLAQGIYSYLPLGWRVLRKISDIVREEMDKEGCQEVMLPIMHPAEIWQESGRWQVYGKELMRLEDRHGHPFCLSPTHEEVMTDLIRSFVSSYKQLPLNLYQIQNKYRDERRPRFGLMRSREFLMKDGYSFDIDEAGMDASYQSMYGAYEKVFSRCGLSFRAVQADAGAIGGSKTHEFMVMAEEGEAAIVFCPECDYAANTEKASMRLERKAKKEALPLEKLATPDKKTIEEVSSFLGKDPSSSLKALIYRAVYADREEVVVAFVRGDREANAVKIQNKLGALALDMDLDPKLLTELGLSPGFMGPVGLEGVRILCDEEIPTLSNLVCGANEADYHYINANPGRDFTCAELADIKEVREGDACPDCGAPLKAARGIEVGQVFKLGSKYSEAMQATVLDKNGKKQVMHMGCYGIGIGRTMQATIEQNHDEWGIVWPKAIAPFEILVMPASHKKAEQMQAAQALYEDLKKEGADVLLDDSKERTGVKFANADLIGYPLRVTAGKKLEEGLIEVMVRRSREVFEFPLEGAKEKILALLADLS